jgi:hypothetical protein
MSGLLGGLRVTFVFVFGFASICCFAVADFVLVGVVVFFVVGFLVVFAIVISLLPDRLLGDQAVCFIASYEAVVCEWAKKYC